VLLLIKKETQSKVKVLLNCDVSAFTVQQNVKGNQSKKKFPVKCKVCMHQTKSHQMGQQ